MVIAPLTVTKPEKLILASVMETKISGPVKAKLTTP